MKCLICGSEVEQAGRGRTKEYCTKECRDLQNYMNAVEKLAGNRPWHSTGMLLFKGRLMDVMNELHGVKTNDKD